MDALQINETSGIGSGRVADTIAAAVIARNLERLYAIGSNAPWVLVLKRLVSGDVLETVVARKHGLSR